MTRRKNRSRKILSEDEELILKVGTYGLEKESAQLPPDAFDTAAIEGVIVKPLYDPLIWALLLEQNTRLKRTIESMALNTVGLGYLLTPVVDEERYIQEYQDAIDAERERIRPLFETPNEEDPLSELMKKIKVDEESSGVGYLEVSRNNAGVPDGLYHVPAHTIRVMADGSGFVQIRNPAAFPLSMTRDSKGRQQAQFLVTDKAGNQSLPDGAVFFKQFGDEKVWTRDGRLPGGAVAPEDRANEIIQFKLYTPRSSFYGVPRHAAAAPAIAGTRLAHIRNVSFFENDACQEKSARILTPTGWQTMGDLAIGAEVIGSDGKAHKVIGIYPQAEKKDIYRVRFKDGATMECTLDHVWRVANSYDRLQGRDRIMSLEAIIADGFHYECGTAKWSIPLTDPVEFDPAPPPPINPYLLGLLLGNGDICGGGELKNGIGFSCNKQDADEFEQLLNSGILPESIQVKRRDRTPSQCSEFRLTAMQGKGKNNLLIAALRMLGLAGCKAQTKFVPEEYLKASVNDRIALLQGLVDTDGFIGDTFVRFTSVSERLIAGVADLVGSLGGITHIHHVTGRNTIDINIRQLPEWIAPARITRKALVYRPKETPRMRTMVGAELVKQGAETMCIRVDSSDNLYITNNYILTHNTPRLAIIVNGGQLSAQSVEMIENFVNAKGKGPTNYGRVMVLQAVPKQGAIEKENKTSIQLMPLTVGVGDDASFSRYTAANNEEVREAFGIGKIFLGTSDDVNRAVALTMKQVTLEQVFEPETLRYEYRINATIMKAMNSKYTKFRFKRPKTTDLNQDAAAYSVLAAAGGVTPNDIRDLLNKDRFRGVFGNTPISIINAGFMEGADGQMITLEEEEGQNAGGGNGGQPPAQHINLTKKDIQGLFSAINRLENLLLEAENKAGA